MINQSLHGSKSSQSIMIRNFLCIFITISFSLFIHYEISVQSNYSILTRQTTSLLLSKQSSPLSQQTIHSLNHMLSQKQYTQVSISQCLNKIYFDVMKNEKYLIQDQDEANGNVIVGRKSTMMQNFYMPTSQHDLTGINTCNQLITLVNYMNIDRVDFIYTNYMQQQYGSFIEDDNQGNSKFVQNRIPMVKFCIIDTQFNNANHKLRQNIKSLSQQNYQNMKLIVLDNQSTDGSYEIAKVILQDLIEKMIKENPKQKQSIQQRFLVIKEQSRLTQWQNIARNSDKCKDMDYIILIDGRDQLISRHVLNILHNQVQKLTQRPKVLTSSVLKLPSISRSVPQFPLSSASSFTFTAIQVQLFQSLKLHMSKAIFQQNLLYPTQIHHKYIEAIYEAVLEDQIHHVREMLYVYDLQGKDRNQYIVNNRRKDINYVNYLKYLQTVKHKGHEQSEKEQQQQSREQDPWLIDIADQIKKRQSKLVLKLNYQSKLKNQKRNSKNN